MPGVTLPGAHTARNLDRVQSMSTAPHSPFDRTSPDFLLATALAEADEEMLYTLIECRHTAGLRQRDVARTLGIAQSSVAAFERHDNDPRLSTIRRYALAVGASIEHTVRPAHEFFGANATTARATATGRVPVTQQLPAETRRLAANAPESWSASVSAAAANSNWADFGLAA